jgi:hypothetical protein
VANEIRERKASSIGASFQRHTDIAPRHLAQSSHEIDPIGSSPEQQSFRMGIWLPENEYVMHVIAVLQ